MAKPLPNEEALYQQIRREKIAVPSQIWDTMYHYLGDAISAVNLIVSFYIEKDEPVPLEDARRILKHTHLIKDAVDRVLHPERFDCTLRQARTQEESAALHPLIRDFFTHYIGNDTHMINLCTSFYLDPGDEQPIPVDDAKKILVQTLSMRKFLDRLREATMPDEPNPIEHETRAV